ncbi:hypothetical protein [Azospirillum humicireducens]|nr:hypothetical protein [Azospirillum humicireducens]
MGIETATVLANAAQGTVIHFTGHLVMPDSASEDVAATARAIERQLARIPIRWGHGSLACGSDLLVAETLLRQGAELTVVLPCAPEDFVDRSVKQGGRTWIARFQRCLDGAHRVITMPWDKVDRPLSFAWADRIAIGSALRQARELEAPATQFAVWNETTPAEGGGTALAVAEWKRLGQTSTSIPCRWHQAQGVATPLAAQPIPAVMIGTDDPESASMPADDAWVKARLPLASIAIAPAERAWLFDSASTAMKAAALLQRQRIRAGRRTPLLLDLASSTLDQPYDRILRESWAVANRPVTPEGTIAATDSFLAESLVATGRHWRNTPIGYAPTRGPAPPTPLYLLDLSEDWEG